MSARFSITVNGVPVQVAPGTTVAAVILAVDARSRISAGGQPRQPLCGMGICYECRAQVDGRPHQRTCQIVCRPGMQVATG